MRCCATGGSRGASARAGSTARSGPSDLHLDTWGKMRKRTLVQEELRSISERQRKQKEWFPSQFPTVEETPCAEEAAWTTSIGT